MKLALFLFRYFPYGGMQRDFLRIATALAQLYSIEIFTTAWQGEIPATLTINTVATRGLSNHARMKNFANAALRQAKQQGCEFIIGFNKMPGLDVYFAADNCYVAQVQEKYGLLYRLTPRYWQYKKLEQQVFAPKQNTKILVLTAAQKKHYQQIYQTPEERFQLLPAEFNRQPVIEINKAEIRERHGIKADENMVLMVCSAFKTKGVGRALRAFSQLNHELLAKTHLLIIGDDRPEPFLRLAKQLGIDTQVQFLGAKKNVLDYMFAADVFLHPAYKEAGGKVLLEAMSCGLPIVTTFECGYAEHVIKADSGIVVPNRYLDDEVLKNSIAWILNAKKADKAAWKTQALAYVANYPATDLVEATIQLMQNLIPYAH